VAPNDSQVIDAQLLTPNDVANFVTSPHPYDNHSVLYRLSH